MGNEKIRKGNVIEAFKKIGWKNGIDYPVPLGDISSLTEDEWLKWRAHGPHWDDPADPDYIPVTLGGSDTETILNISPWNTPLQLFHEKTGRKTAIKEKGNEEAFAAGHKYEPYVAETLLEKLRAEKWVYSIDMMDDTTMYQCGQRRKDGSLKYPWALADFDRFAMINGQPWIVELKTTSSHNFDVIKEWQQGICPVYYEFQVRHYMAIANVDHAVICCAWGFKSDENAFVVIERDLDIEEELMAAEADFCMCVEAGIEPDLEPQNKALLMKYYAVLYGLPSEKKPMLELEESSKDKIDAILDAQKEVERKKEELEEAKKVYSEKQADLLPTFVGGDGTFLYSYAYFNDQTTGDHIGIKLKMSKKKAAIDEEKFRKEHPIEYKKCLETVFSMSKLTALDKAEKSHLKADYLLPPEPNEKHELSLELKVTKKATLST